jgi:CheY-like chemotaxis protein
MKILYVANERSDAQLAANALRDLGLRLAWAGSLSAGLRWVQDNRDVAALVVEAEVQNESCPPFVARIRGLGLTAPMIVVAPERLGTPLAALRAGADDYVLAGESLLANLRASVGRLLQQATAQSTNEPVRLLYVGDATLAQQCLESRPRSIELIEAARGPEGAFQIIPPGVPAGEPLPFDVVLVEHDHAGVDAFAILKELAARHVPVIVVVEWDEKLALPAFKLGAADCVVKAADAFQALLFKLERRTAPLSVAFKAPVEDPERSRERDALQATIEQERRQRTALEAKLQGAEAARRDAENRLALETTSREAQAAERQAQYDAALAKAAEAHIAVEERLASQLAARATELTDNLAEVTGSRDTLVEQLREAAIALDEVRQERAAESAAAARRFERREAELGATLAEAIASREALERRLFDVEAARQQAEQRGSVERQAAEETARDRRAFEKRLADETAVRQTLEQKLASEGAARRNADERHTSELAAAAERLAEQQRQHETARAELAAARDGLQQKLA